MKKLVKKVAPWIFIGTSLLVFPASVLAEETSIDIGKPWQELGLKFTIGSLVSGVLKFILIAAAVIFFVMLLIGGVQWMLSGGDKAATEAARNKITAALIGLVIVFSGWAIASLIESFFGFNIFDLTIKPIEKL